MVRLLATLAFLALTACTCKAATCEGYGFFEAIKMTQAERNAASDACEAKRFTPQERARWECSRRIEAGYKAGAVEWVRRSQWVTVRDGNGWVVRAVYTLPNVARVQYKTCKVIL